MDLTVINLALVRDAILDGKERVDGVVEATAWAGDRARTVIDGAEVVLPATLRFDISASDDNPTIRLQPNPGTWCWCIVIKFKGRLALTRYVIVPAVSPVNFGALELADKTTFLPLPEVPPSSQELIAAANETLREVTERTVTGTIHPTMPGVIRLEYPAYMTHPDHPLILVLPVEAS